jgi:o-succinylbenzoate synthase
MFSVRKYPLQFTFDAGTSRGILRTKTSWFIQQTTAHGTFWGECSVLPGLSPDPANHYEQQLSHLVQKLNVNPSFTPDWISQFPSIRFGLEMLRSHASGQWFDGDTPFVLGQWGIPINGLVWMGSPEVMRERLAHKLNEGYRVIKLKIGAVSWADEQELIRQCRRAFPASDLEIRVDANGAFAPEEAPRVLDFLAAQQVHSIEQPIAPRQWEAMARLCEQSAVPIALDEELIGLDPLNDAHTIAQLKATYLILKPSLLGGAAATRAWVEVARTYGLGWWLTSALESNVGLFAIARLAEELGIDRPQGLGTGGLYHNNIPGSLAIRNAALWNNPETPWDFSPLL